MTGLSPSSTGSDYADLVAKLHEQAEWYCDGHGPLHALAANAIEHLTTMLRSVGAAQAAPEPEGMWVEANKLANVLIRCQTVLGNMALENETGLASIFDRWPISHEPLRADARGLVPVIADALAEYHQRWMAAAPQPASNAYSSQQPRWRHKKRGTTYVEVGRANLQIATDPVEEDDRVVIYRSEADGRLWVRGEAEFEDGRFEALSIPSTPSAPEAKPQPADCGNRLKCGWHHVRTEPDIGLHMCREPGCPHMARAHSSTDLGSGR